MKHFVTLISALALSLSAMASTTFSFTNEASVKQTINGYTVEIAKAESNNPPAIYNDHLRLYAKNTITVSGADLSRISLSFSKQGSKEYASLSASAGKLTSGGSSTSNDDIKTDVWTGSAQSVTFTLGDSGQRIIYRIIINGTEADDEQNPGGGSSGGGTGDPSTPGELNPDFVYMEPTLVTVPATTVQGDAYTFISNNILVSCTKGAITDSYFSAHAGFKMTFTATKDIKGIVVNGFVKKDFEASVDNGKISYLSPSEDSDGQPVVVITDIDSKSVTITCVKQLRCYDVEVYFDANPEAVVSGGTQAPEGGNFTFDSAEAVYESEYSELMGEENYSVFLYNEADPYYVYFALDIYPETPGDITGTYAWDDYTLGDYTYYAYGEGDYDVVWIEGGSVTITKSGDIYNISGALVGDNYQTYNISYSGPIPIYTDDEYYGDESGVEKVTIDNVPASDNDAMYDLQGRKVGKDFRGIYIHRGQKHINR